VLVVAIGALAIVTGDGGEEQVASADLEVLVDAEATGAATLVRPADTDNLVLVLDVGGLEPVDGYYEVWLLTPEVDGLVSLGPLRADGRYDLPPGLDHRQFSVVDISIEPHDGDPTHSGNSILRGGLVEA
jgi:anti-sigma-K factor RskA